MDDDVCHDRRCWASLSGHFTGDVLEGGRVDATTWPVQPQQAIDIYFDGKDATYPAGYYRGVIDTATTPSKTGIQKLDVDFPDDRTSARLDLKRSQIYDPGTEPAEPGAADGEVARVVRAADLPDADVSATPYGLTVDQVRVIKDLYYGDFHYAGRDRLYELLTERARKDGKLEERTIKRKDGEVTVSTPYGIRYRQLQQYLAAMEHRQLHKRPTKVKTTRSFVTPIAPMRRLMADTMDLGKAGGGRAGTQRYVIGIIDPSSKWVHAEVFQGKAPREEQTRQVLVNGLKSLRDGLLAHKTGNSAQVFDDKGALLHTLVFASDNGNEFKGGFTEAARKDLVDAGLITGADRFIHRYNLASAPTQAAHIERLWSTLRTKLKLAVQAEFGGITRKAAKDARRETYSTRDQKEGLGTYGQSKNAQGWTTWVRRAIEAVNAERAAGTDIAPNDYLSTYVTRGKATLERKTAEGADAELDAKGERQLKHQEELTVNTMVRRLDLAKAKASLKDKFAPNWSTEVFRVVKVTKQRSKGLGNASFLYQIARTNGDAVAGSYRREELQIVPTMQDSWNPGVSKGREYIDKLRADNVISGWDSKHNRFERTGNKWSEQEVDKLGERAWKRGGMTREKTLRRLEQYMKQGMSKDDALTRLKDSLEPAHSGPANPGKLAITGIDD